MRAVVRSPYRGGPVERVALFARWPELGRVKTRLSPALPPELALRLYEAMLEDALGAMSRCGADESFVYWADAPPDRGLWDGKITPARSQDQAGEDLGARLERAFDDLLKHGPARAVILGADCPMLDADMLRRAFDALAEHDLVLGPSRDGGYYLIGLRRRCSATLPGEPTRCSSKPSTGPEDFGWRSACFRRSTISTRRGIWCAGSHRPLRRGSCRADGRRRCYASLDSCRAGRCSGRRAEKRNARWDRTRGCHPPRGKAACIGPLTPEIELPGLRAVKSESRRSPHGARLEEQDALAHSISSAT